MVRRENSPQFINALANSPAVRPFIDYRGEAAPLDFSPAVGFATQTGIIWLSNGDDAVAAFEQAGERDWNVHILFGETRRGGRALETAREMLAYMTPYADAIWGLIPVKNAAARWFARQLGAVAIEATDDEGMGRCEVFVWRKLH